MGFLWNLRYLILHFLNSSSSEFFAVNCREKNLLSTGKIDVIVRISKFRADRIERPCSNEKLRLLALEAGVKAYPGKIRMLNSLYLSSGREKGNMYLMQ